ncbi:MAG: hypothetical protein HQK81_04515 [Desulfovibrionaceae bacterium]|nr:hypothetical protein [Desulfovibrionaceae bacterium]MBF0513308.1 hypothetical protein [Desulfovibrionaceae bacterium]
MIDREKFIAQMEEGLKRVKEKLDAAKESAAAKGKTILEQGGERLKKLEAKYEETRYKLTLLRNGGDSAWTELKLGFENAYAELKDALGKAKDKF